MNGKLYAHYADYTGDWPWEHFSPREISCKCCGEMYLHKESMNALERLRDLVGPIRINSGHRCEKRNFGEGGVDNSMHLKVAFDCQCPKRDQADFVKAAEKAGFTGIGYLEYRTFVHVDMGRKRRW